MLRVQPQDLESLPLPSLCPLSAWPSSSALGCPRANRLSTLAPLVLQAVPMGTPLMGQEVPLKILDSLLATVPELVATLFLQRQMLL